MRMKNLFILFTIPCFAFGKINYKVILERNIFTAPYIEKKDVKKTNILKPAPPPSLDSLIEVKGIILLGKTGYAIIGIKRKNTEVIVRKNETVAGAKVVEMGTDFIVFLYNGKKEKIQIKKDTKSGNFIKAVPGVNVKIEKKKVENPELKTPDFKEPVAVDFDKTIEELKNDKNLFKNLNISPYIVDGKVEGFKLSKLPDNSIPFKYGLRKGDIVHRVNGILIDSITKGYAVYNQIVQSGTKIVTVEVLRNGKPVVLSYKLK